jgi:hypothetical protein
MSTGPLDTYLQQLARALRDRGHEASRIVDEAREHLTDAVEDGLGRGLTRAAAEHEAIQRFGPPEVIAAQAPAVRNRTMARLIAALDLVVGNWRWMTGATAVAAVLTAAVSHYVLPTFYRSETVIVVVPQPLRPWQADFPRPAGERMQAITRAILSDARLDRIVEDFRLGPTEQVRRDISVTVAMPAQAGTSDPLGIFKVSFQSPDPQLSMKVTERLAGLFILENLEDQERAGALGRAIGDQFRVTTPPRLPTDPLRPGMTKMTVSGAFAGLALSIVALAWRKDR